MLSTKTQVLRDLVRLEKLFTPDESWIRGDWAENDDGDTVDPESNDGTCFCLAGGVQHVCRVRGFNGWRRSHDRETNVAVALNRQLERQGFEASSSYFYTSFGPIVDWNDKKHRRRSDVLKLIANTRRALQDDIINLDYI